VNRDLGEGRERLPTGSSEGEAGWENLRINRVGTSESKDTESTEDEVLQQAENESGFFKQEDSPTKKQLRRDEAESERSGERLPLAARRVSAANQFVGYTGGLWEWIGYDGLEGQRPRLTHF